MGGVVKSLFGGGSSKSSSTSSNRSWDVLRDPLTSAVSGGVNNLGNLSDILNQGFDAYKKNAGFDFQLNQGNRNIAGGAAAKGLLNSGSTAKALAEYESNLGNTMYGNWLDRLGGVAQMGLGAAGPLVGAGSTSSSTGKSNDYGKGILGTLFG